MRMNGVVELLIDCRMGAEVGRVHTVRPYDPDSSREYATTLHPAEEAERLLCSARAIIYCPSSLSAVAAAIVKRYAMDEPIPADVFLDLANLRMFTG